MGPLVVPSDSQEQGNRVDVLGALWEPGTPARASAAGLAPAAALRSACKSTQTRHQSFPVPRKRHPIGCGVGPSAETSASLAAPARACVSVCVGCGESSV